MFSATCAITSAISPSVSPARRAVSTSESAMRPCLATSWRANCNAPACFGEVAFAPRADSSSASVRPVILPIAVCAERQYWQEFCSATASAISSRSFASSVPPASAPLNDKYPCRTAGELAITLVMFGVIWLSLGIVFSLDYSVSCRAVSDGCRGGRVSARKRKVAYIAGVQPEHENEESTKHGNHGSQNLGGFFFHEPLQRCACPPSA